MWIRRWGIAIKILHKVWEFFDLRQDSGSYLCLAFPPQSSSLNQWLAKQQAKVCPMKNVHSIFFLLSSISGPGCPKPGSISSPATPSSAPFHANPSPCGNYQEFISILQHLFTLDWKGLESSWMIFRRCSVQLCCFSWLCCSCSSVAGRYLDLGDLDFDFDLAEEIFQIPSRSRSNPKSKSLRSLRFNTPENRWR